MAGPSYFFSRRHGLQDLCDGAEVSPLLVAHALLDSNVDDVEGIGGHNCRVHVAVVDEITHNLWTTI